LENFKDSLIRKLNYMENALARHSEEIASNSNRNARFYNMPPFLSQNHLWAEVIH
jgi:hypothetical protein